MFWLDQKSWMALVKKSTASSGRLLIMSVERPVAPGALSYFVLLIAALTCFFFQGFDQSCLWFHRHGSPLAQFHQNQLAY